MSLEYILHKSDREPARYHLSYSELRGEYLRFCDMSDAEFMTVLPNAAHLACIISFIKELGAEATLADEGIVHQLIHLMTIPVAEYGQAVPEIRDLFRSTLLLAP